MFFEDFNSLARTAIVGVLAYVVMVIFLRISGRRTLSKMNAFDFVVTVALGSTLATVLLNQSVSLAQGATAFALLIGLQYIVTWTNVRLQYAQKVVTGEPILLFFQGDFLPQALKKARVTENEVRSAIRSNANSEVGKVGTVVLETDGSFSVITGELNLNSSSLSGVNTKSLNS